MNCDFLCNHSDRFPDNSERRVLIDHFRVVLSPLITTLTLSLATCVLALILGQLGIGQFGPATFINASCPTQDFSS
jgi:hypothetical protein